MTVKKDFSLVCLSVEHYNTYFPALQIIFICVSLSSAGFVSLSVRGLSKRSTRICNCSE